MLSMHVRGGSIVVTLARRPWPVRAIRACKSFRVQVRDSIKLGRPAQTVNFTFARVLPECAESACPINSTGSDSLIISTFLKLRPMRSRTCLLSGSDFVLLPADRVQRPIRWKDLRTLTTTPMISLSEGSSSCSPIAASRTCSQTSSLGRFSLNVYAHRPPFLFCGSSHSGRTPALKK